MRAPRIADGPHVEIIVDKDGTVHTEVKGVQGPSCKDLTDKFERNLGGVLISSTLKPEHSSRTDDKARA